jgi:hypothetical protein
MAAARWKIILRNKSVRKRQVLEQRVWPIQPHDPGADGVEPDPAGLERTRPWAHTKEWDREFVADAQAGRLDWLVEEARQEQRDGRCTDR